MERLILLVLLVGVTWAGAEQVSRGKRQLDSDPVPIIDGSYFDRDDRPAAKFFSQFDRPEDLQRPIFPEFQDNGNSRPQLRSLDGSDGDWQDGFQESQRTRKTFKRRTSRKSIQVKSRDGDEYSEIPHFSEEVTYRRSNNADNNGQQQQRQQTRSSTQLRSLDTSSSRAGCVTPLRCQPSTDDHQGRGDLQLRSLDTSSGTNHHRSSSSQSHSAVRSGRESEGLRLYTKLIEGGSRARSQNSNRLRSLDGNGGSQGWNQRSSSSQSSSSSSSQDSSTTQMHLQSGQPVPSQIMSSAGLHSGELYYRRSNNGGRRQQSNNGQSSSSRVRSLSSSSSQRTRSSSNSNSQSNGGSSLSCLNNCRSSSSSTLVSPQQQTVLRSLPSSTGQSSSSWAEKEERSHSSSRSISHTVNGVETNGLGRPYESEEEATYRREASGGDQAEANAAAAAAAAESTSHQENNVETRSLSSIAIERTSQRQEEPQPEPQRPTPAPKPTLSVGNYEQQRERQRQRRLNCSQIIQTTSLSEGAQTAAQFLATPPPCLQRAAQNTGRNCQSCVTRSQSSQTETRSSHNRDSDNAIQYPPVQVVGQGDDQVHARVLSSDDDNHQQENIFEQHSSSNDGNGGQRQEVSYTTGGRRRKGYYRRTVFKNFTTEEHPSTFETWLTSS